MSFTNDEIKRLVPEAIYTEADWHENGGFFTIGIHTSGSPLFDALVTTRAENARRGIALKRIQSEAGKFGGSRVIALLAEHALSGVDEGVCPTCRNIAPMEYDFRGYGYSGGKEVEMWDPCETCKGKGFLVILPEAIKKEGES